MKLRFKVNQAEALRRGIDSPKSTAVVEIDPAKLSQEQRDLIADRLDGIDVCQVNLGPGDKVVTMVIPQGTGFKPRHVEADGPAFEDLMKAVLKDQERLEAIRLRHRNLAAIQDAEAVVRGE